MMKFTIACVAVAAFAAPALAEEPDGSFVFKDPNTTTIENSVGQSSAQIIQNGQFVSGNCEPVCAELRPDDLCRFTGRRWFRVSQASQGRGRDK